MSIMGFSALRDALATAGYRVIAADLRICQVFRVNRVI
jgi:hypothetical protein